MRYLTRFLFLLGGLCLLKASYIPAKKGVGDILIERAWRLSQASGKPVHPWPWMDTVPLARLSVPKLGDSEIILNSSSGQALAFAPGHLPQTAKPGQSGLSVIAAHKNTHFDFLEHVEIGDIIEVENLNGDVTRYKTTSLDIIDKNDFEVDLNTHENQAKIALVTCYPFSRYSYGGPLRYIVHGEAIPESSLPQTGK